MLGGITYGQVTSPHTRRLPRPDSSDPTGTTAARYAKGDAAAAEQRKAFEDVAAKLDQSFPDACNTANTYKGNINFYPPFSPNDGLADVWCKLQTFHASGPIVIGLKAIRFGAVYQQIIAKSEFSPDGQIHSSGRNGAHQIIFGLEEAGLMGALKGGAFWQHTDQLGKAGGITGPNSGYTFYNGALLMQIDGVQINGMPFRIVAQFSLNAGLLANHFAKNENMMEVPVGTWIHGSTGYQTRVVAFPMSLNSITFDTSGPQASTVGEQLAKSIGEKYAKWALPVPRKTISNIDPLDPTKVMKEYGNGDALVRVTQGQSRFSPYLSIIYLTTSKFDLGQKQFDAWAKTNAQETSQAAKEQAKGSQF